MRVFVITLLLALAIVNNSADNSVDESTDETILKNDDATETKVRVSFSNESVVSEMQQTMCSVKTEEFVAKAQSTVSRILTGVCTSDELTRALRNMENSLLERLDHVRQDLVDFIQAKFNPVIHKRVVNKNSKFSPFRTVDYLFDEKKKTNVFKNYT